MTAPLSFPGAALSDVPALSGLPLYALIDPLLGEPQACDADPESLIRAKTYGDLAALRSSGWRRDVWLADDPEPVVDAVGLPYLVRLSGKGDPKFLELIQAAQTQAELAREQSPRIFSFGAFIESDSDPNLLMQRLQRMWSFRVPRPAQYIRLADPSVFEAFMHWLPVDQMRRWLGPIAAWHIYTRQGAWAACLGAAAEQFIDEPEAYQRTQRLRRIEALPGYLPDGIGHLPDLMLMSAVIRTLNEMERLNEGSALRDSASLHEAAWQAVRRARTLGLHDKADLAAYAWRALSVPGFEGQLSASDTSSVKRQTALAVRQAISQAGTLERRLSAIEINQTENETP